MKKLGKTIGCLTIPASILSLSQVLWEDMEQFMVTTSKPKNTLKEHLLLLGKV